MCSRVVAMSIWGEYVVGSLACWLAGLGARRLAGSSARVLVRRGVDRFGVTCECCLLFFYHVSLLFGREIDNGASF